MILLAWSLEMTPDWHPNLRRLFELTDPSTCFPINIKTSVPLDPWPASNVTLHRRRDSHDDARPWRRREHRVARRGPALRDGSSMLPKAGSTSSKRSAAMRGR